MDDLKKMKLLKIYLADSRNDQGRRLYEVIVEKAREMGIAGVTMYHQGLAGYGCREGEMRNMVPSLSQTPPIVIDVIDTPKVVDAFITEVKGIYKTGLMITSMVDLAHRTS